MNGSENQDPHGNEVSDCVQVDAKPSMKEVWVASLSETAYLLKSPKNARRLLAAVAESEADKGRERALIE